MNGIWKTGDFQPVHYLESLGCVYRRGGFGIGAIAIRLPYIRCFFRSFKMRSQGRLFIGVRACVRQSGFL